MTDRISGFLVTLAEDVREDDVNPTVQAILQLRGVIECRPVKGGIETAIATARAKMQIGKKLVEVLQAD